MLASPGYVNLQPRDVSLSLEFVFKKSDIGLSAPMYPCVRLADLRAHRRERQLPAHSGQYCALHECLSGARCCQLIVLLDDRLERLYGLCYGLFLSCRRSTGHLNCPIYKTNHCSYFVHVRRRKQFPDVITIQDVIDRRLWVSVHCKLCTKTIDIPHKLIPFERLSNGITIVASASRFRCETCGKNNVIVSVIDPSDNW